MGNPRRLLACVVALFLALAVGPFDVTLAHAAGGFTKVTVQDVYSSNPNDTSTTLTGVEHTYESVNYKDDVAVPTGSFVWFKVISGPNQGLVAHCPVIGNATALWPMTSRDDGVDTLLGWFEPGEPVPSPLPSPGPCFQGHTGEVPSDTAIRSDVDYGSGLPPVLTHTWSHILLSPVNDTTTVSSPGHPRPVSLTATIDSGASDVNGPIERVVTFVAHRSGGLPDVTEMVTTAKQRADFTYERFVQGVDDITATFQYCSDGCGDFGPLVTASAQHTWQIANNISLTPAEQTDFTGGTARYTVDVVDQDGNDAHQGGVCLSVTSTSGDTGHNRVLGPFVFDAQSPSTNLVFNYSASTPGSDDVQANYFRYLDQDDGGTYHCPQAAQAEVASSQSLQHWVAVTLAPTGTTSDVGLAHQLTATVFAGGEGPSGSTLTIRVVSGPGAGESQTVSIDPAGHAVASFTGAVAGTSHYVANYRTSETGPDSLWDSAPATHEWTVTTPPPPPTTTTTLTLSPASSGGDVGSTHTVTATVTTVSGSQAPARLVGAVVMFTQASGPSAGWPRMGLTDAFGTASVSYTSALPGSDVLVATVGPASSNLATRTWNAVVVATPTPTPTPEPTFPTVPPIPPVVIPTIPPVVTPTPVPVVPAVTPPVVPVVDHSNPAVVAPTQTPTPVATTPAPAPPPVETGGLGDATAVTLETPSTLPGGEASVSGSSCPAGSPVTALINGVVVGTATADSTGAYTAKLNVPDLAIGQYQITVRCGTKTGAVALDLVVSTAAPFSAASAATTGLVLLFLVLLLLLYVGNAQTGAGRVKPDDESWSPFTE